jgi:hypothetical protein
MHASSSVTGRKNNHGGPHVETADDIAQGTRRALTLHPKQGPANRHGSAIFSVEGVHNERSEYGGHITVPLEFAK